MTFNIFDVFRDRQITNSILHNKAEIKILKSRNIFRDGTKIIELDDYDKYAFKSDLEKLSVYKYLNDDDVYLTPNMTYYPRVIRKPKNVLVNGSVAILKSNYDQNIIDKNLGFWSSLDFENFFKIARNMSTRSLNIDRNSIYYFGLLIKD